MSLSPVFAALTGLAVLGQSLPVVDWPAIAVIVTVNGTAAGPRRTEARSAH
jgi:inner membrane transporter RhtA